MYFPNYQPSGVNNIRKVTILLTLLCIVTVLVTFSSSQSSLINQNQITDILSKIVDGSAVLDNYGQLPLSFEANQGQVDSQVEFLSRGDGYTMYLTGDEAIMVLNKPVNDGTIGSADVIRLQLVGANVEARTVGEEKLPGKVNYFIGNNPEQWQTGISTYSQVRYEDVYPGIDLVYYGNQSQLEYDFVVHPGVDPDAIALRFDGTDSIQIDPKGNLVLSLGEEQLIQNPPIVYQEVEGKRLEVDGAYVFQDQNKIGFSLGTYDENLPLIIDPILVYATYLGSSDADTNFGLDVDSNGNAYLTGRTYSLDFPTTTGVFDDSLDGTRDLYVVKIDPTGSNLIYATYIGGTSDENGFALDVDSSGNVYVTGGTRSTDFPVTSGAFDTTRNSTNDSYVVKLDSSGSSLHYATYLGGNNNDDGFAIMADDSGQAHVVGFTFSSDFPTTAGAFDTNFNTTTCTYGSLTNNCRDVFAIKLDATGSTMLYGTYIGGSGDDFTYRADLDAAGDIYIMGMTDSNDFPTTNSAVYPTINGGGTDAFVAKLDATGTNLVYATYLGGSDDETSSPVIGGIAVDDTGHAYITGLTRSSDFPVTSGAFDTTYNGQQEPFVAKLDPTGSSLIFSTFIGGSANDYGAAIAIDSLGNSFITGQTSSGNLPITPGAFQANLNSHDAYLIVLNDDGSAIIYGSYLGGSDTEVGGGIVVAGTRDVYISGATRSTNFPATSNAFSQNYGGGFEDGFLVKVRLPCTVTNLNDSGPGSLRDAISCANSNPGPDTITFQVAGTINILSQLPTLADTIGGTLIDGTTAPGYAGSPAIVLDGPGTGSAVRGLRITSADNEVRALQIQDFSGGILLEGAGATGNKITRSYLGTDGIFAADTAIGVYIDGGSNNVIGTDGDGLNDALEGNVISGNSSRGISITGTGATGNVVAGNYIGTNAAGTAAVFGQNQDGVVLLFGAEDTIIGTNGDGVSDVEERNIISGNPGAGVYVSGPSGAVVAGNYIGTDVTGTAEIGNATFNDVFTAGIYLGGDNARIGTNGDGLSDAIERNIISGNNFRGIILNGPDDAIIAGNYIGTDVTGTAALPNETGVFGLSGANLVLGTNGDGSGDTAEGNLISGNNLGGVSLQSGVTGVVAGNIIGLDASGTAVLPNIGNGLSFSGANKLVGTNSDGVSDTAERNVVSGNTTNGINASSASNVVIAGNYIGTDITGSVPLGNEQWGLQINGDVRLGTNADGINDVAERNVISGNGSTFSFVSAVLVSGSGATVAGNYIGTDATGTVAMGNNGDGVRISSGSHHTIGGSAAGAGNIIANSGAAGVAVPSSSSANNLILGNEIYNNGGLGIDLGSTGVTLNDTGDGDSGANTLQNFPVITDVKTDNFGTMITGTLNSSANTSYNLEFFSNSNCDPSGYGEGETLIGTTSATTNGSGDTTFSVTFGSVLTAENVTATATDPNDNTSEFSACYIPPNQPPVAVDDSYTTDEDTPLSVPSSPPVTTIGPLLAADISVASTANSSGRVPMAFDGSRYLAVYGDQTGDIYGVFVETDGTVGTPFLVASTAGTQFRPDVAYNGSYYLVAYEDNGGGGIGMQVVNTAGSLIGSPQTVTAASNTQSEPALASDGSGFLIVWQDARNSTTDYFDIWGRLVDVDTAGTATFNGTDFLISPAAESQFFPNIAYGSGQYLVTWTNDQFFNAFVFDVKGAFVDSAGTVSSPIDISTATGNQGSRAAGVDFDGSNFLVVFDDFRNGSDQVYGMRVSTSGTLLDGTAATGGIAINSSAGFGGPHRPQVVAGSEGWLVAWGGTQIRGTRVAADGTVVDPTGPSLFVTSGSQWDPSLAFDGDNFLVTWRVSSVSQKFGQLIGEIELAPDSILSNDNDPDGGSITAVLDTTVSNGSLTLNTDGSFDYTPDPDFCGPDSFTYVANDGIDDSNIATVTIDVVCVNDPPVAVDDIYSTVEDTPLGVTQPGVLLNDLDADGDILSAVLDTTTSDGTLTLTSNGFFSYFPDPDFCGEDSFTYHANDGTDDSNIATVTIRVVCVNDPPSAIADTATTPEDTAVTVSVLSNDSDVEGETLTVVSVTQPPNGTVTINPNNTVTYTPAQDYNSTDSPFGVDSFTYTIQDASSGTDTAQVDITVTPVNDPPTAVDDTASTNEDTAITITVLSNDSDVDGDTISVSAVSTPANGVATINPDNTITYTPATNYNGTDSFVYTIDDGQEETATATVTIQVSAVNDPPAAVDDVVSVDEDSSVMITVLANDSDVDGDPLTVTNLTAPANGTAVLNGDNSITYTSAADYNGPDSFSYTISDGLGGEDTATVIITVNPINDDPIAADDAVSTAEDTAITVDVLANDNDIDGDTLTVTFVSTPANGTAVINPDNSITYTPNANFEGVDSVTYTISDGNGGTDTAVLNITVTSENDNPSLADDAVTTDEDVAVTIDVLANDSDVDGDSLSVTNVTTPANGTAVINGDNTVTYTPDANYYGPDSFVYTVSDGQGGSDSATVIITVNPVNDAPDAVNDNATTNEDLAVIIDLLGNDSDIEGDSLTVSAFTQPPHGTVVDNNDGTVTYTPDADYNGPDSFSYTISDGNGGSDMASVFITVDPVNDAPVAANDSATVDEDNFVTINLLNNDFDVDGDTLTVDTVTTPANGTVVDNGNGTVTYTPAPNYNGADSFSYTIIDGNGGSDTANVTVAVNPVNDLPVAADDTAVTDEDTAVVVPVVNNDTDVDGDTLTVESTSLPANGTVVINGDNTVTYTPLPNFNGVDSFTYTINDGNGGMDTATVVVTVNAVNDAPDAVDDTVATPEDTAITIDVLANDNDVDGDSLSVTSITNPSNGTAVINPDNSVTYTPAANFEGTDNFVYTISDGNGGTDTALVTISVSSENDNPVAVDDNATTNEDTAATIPVLNNDSDVDGDTLSVASVTTPANGTAVINPDNSVTYTPNANFNGSDSFVYTVEDGNGGSDTAVVSITVLAVNDAPQAVNDNATTDQETAVTVDVLANDSDVDGDALTVTAVSSPANGSAVINPPSTGSGQATVTYTPAPGFFGVDTFTYTINDGNGGSDTATITIDVLPVVAACDLYPIALSEDILAGAQAGDILEDILNGSQPGNFGWLTWNGNNITPALIASLTQPGNSHIYQNPDDANDHVVSIGDWIEGKPGVSNAKEVRNALDDLIGVEIVVPVWDVTQGNGANAEYHVVAFARIRILDYYLPGQDMITAEFLGFTSCATE